MLPSTHSWDRPPDILGGLRRSVESLVAQGSQDKSELQEAKTELAKARQALRETRERLLKQKEQNAVLKSILERFALHQKKIFNDFKSAEENLSTCSSLVKKGNLIEDQRHYLLQDFQHLVTGVAERRSKSSRRIKALLDTLISQVNVGEQMKKTLKAKEMKLNIQEHTRQGEQHKLMLHHCSLLRVAKEAADVKYTQGVLDLKAQTFCQRLVDWVAGVRCVHLRERALWGCAVNTRAMTQKVKSASLDDVVKFDHNDAMYLDEFDVACLQTRNNKKMVELNVVGSKIFTSAPSSINSNARMKLISHVCFPGSHFFMVKAYAEALRKQQATKNQAYLQTTMKVAKKRKELPKIIKSSPRAKKSIKDEDTFDPFANIMSSCDS